ncbi:filamentous hemagglutinin N-terminal domain-containing protein [Pleurocapsa sp. PCC 7319]|uniref:two-partner secretion domain-containing protein n=1 Tax=Pleurocapsa sp. PCC 7319 TaxID=118161 RepID=UPI00034C71CF|nr:filamentous hemagglutinin N-terminal domain-containing protein [Pleurocapsa sp. PCC 7319]
MKHIIYFNIAYLIVIAFCFHSNKVSSQILPDDSLNTQVNQNNNIVEITGGQTRGSNLFHSFQQFSLLSDNEAVFDNGNNIANIFSRVTGGNLSNIDGLIKANGGANLYLINPAGIIFGKNARLNIGGSFLASTADSILFPDGVEFSASDPQAKPLLTINAPIGLNLGDNPGQIINRSVAGGFVENLEFVRPKFTIEQTPVGLQVKPGKNLSLIGGEVKLDNGNIYAPGGKVELGGLEEAGIVSISENGSLNFPNDKVRSNVSLTNLQQLEFGSIVNVAGEDGGSIKVHGRNLELSGKSFFFAGIKEASSTSNAQAGNVEIDVTENIVLDRSRISNIVSSEVEGNSGNINIQTKNLSIFTSRESDSNQDIGNISTNILGTGDAGEITINASDKISLEAGNKRFGSIQSTIEPSGIGNAGDIKITTGSLSLKGRNSVRSNTLGQGDAGNVTIKASEQISLEGQFISEDSRFSTGIASQERPGAEGNGGNIVINTPFLSLSDYSQITASAQSGQGGNIRITVEDLFLRNTSRISVGTGNIADGGNLFIDARFIVAFPEQSTNLPNFANVGILANANRGNGGNIDITSTGIFGIEERAEEAGVNFITASSNLGIDGVVEINTPEIDSTQGLKELPIAFTIPQPAEGCQANRDEDSSSFMNTGRGGLPPNPYDPLDSSDMFVDVQLPTEWINELTTNSSASLPNSLSAAEPIIEANKWVLNEKGNVELVSDTSNIVATCGDYTPSSASPSGRLRDWAPPTARGD